MLVACRLAGLSALEAYYAAVDAHAQMLDRHALIAAWWFLIAWPGRRTGTPVYTPRRSERGDAGVDSRRRHQA